MKKYLMILLAFAVLNMSCAFIIKSINNENYSCLDKFIEWEYVAYDTTALALAVINPALGFFYFFTALTIDFCSGAIFENNCVKYYLEEK